MVRWPTTYLGAWAFDVHPVAAGVVELREAYEAADLIRNNRNKETYT
jgi:hypothetical protein